MSVFNVLYAKFIAPVWTRYGIWPFILFAILLLVAAYVFRVDLGAWANRLLGV